MKSFSLGFVPVVLALAIVDNTLAVEVTWVTRYCNEEIRTIPPDPVPDTYVRMWVDIYYSRLYERPDYLVGAKYLVRRTNYVNLCPELQGIGELYEDWLGENRVEVSEECTILAAIRWIDDTQRQGLLSEGWYDLEDTISIQRYAAGNDPYDLFARDIPAGIVSVPTQTIDEPLRMVFMFQPIPEPSTLILLSMGAVGLLAYAWRKRRR